MVSGRSIVEGGLFSFTSSFSSLKMFLFKIFNHKKKGEAVKSILILVASSGMNAKLSQSILESAQNLGHKVSVTPLLDLNLPLYSEAEERKGIPIKAQELSKKMLEADSLVFTAPEYNGSVPPCLTNAICWVSRTGENWRQAFNGKTTLIATHSGGGGDHVLMAMRMQLSFLGANVLGRQIKTTYKKELDLDSLEACLKQL